MRRALPCGEGAVLIECDDGEDALALWRRLQDRPPRQVREAVPGARSVLVVGSIDRRLRDELLSMPGLPSAPVGDPDDVVVPVVYDGADLHGVAAATGLDAAEVARRHAAGHYVAAFSGFAPGFAYLTGLDPRLEVPRRSSPRTRVPAGAVAIADRYTGVYPGASPGGWNLIGHTEAVMFDAARTPAALLRPGARVRFSEVG